MSSQRPTFLDGALTLLLGPEADVVIGDLDEEWPERVGAVGRWAARAWYVKTMMSTIGTVMVRGRGGMPGSERKVRRGGWATDLRREVRSLRRAPLWTVLAVGTVSVGMTFATVVVALIDARRTDLVPFPDADRLYAVRESNGTFSGVADPTLRRMIDRSDVFEGVAAWSTWQAANLTRVDADPAVARVAPLLPGSFGLLGYTAVVGRALEPSDGDPRGGLFAVLSYGYWTREFGGSPEALGSTLQLNGRSYEVVGVMSPGTRVPGGDGASTDVWTPIQRLPSLETDPGLRYQVVARAGSLLGTQELLASAQSIMDELRRSLPQWRSDPTWRMEVTPLRVRLEGGSTASIRALSAGAILLLVLAAANLVALTLARLQGRAREFVVLTALGAPPSIATRRVVLQNAVVGTLAAVVASLGGAWMLGVVSRSRPTWLPGAGFASVGVVELSVSFTIAIVLSLGAALLADRLLPGMGSATELLRARGPDRRWRFVARSLVLVETGMVVGLAVGAGLLLRSLTKLGEVELADTLESRVVARVDLLGPAYGDSEAVRRFTDDVLRRVRGAPGVLEAATSTSAPFAPAVWNFVILEDRDPSEGALPTSELEEVTPGYFDATGIDVVAGRPLVAADYGASAEKVVVVNEALARLYEGAAVGRTLNYTEGPILRVVGVVRDVPAGSLEDETPPRVYVADLDDAFPWTMRTRWFVAHLSGPGATDAFVSGLRSAVREADPAIALHPARTLADLRVDLLREAGFRGLAFGLLGVVALLLGAAGIYGVVSHALGSARRETGIRLALGASRWRVFLRTVRTEAGSVLAGASLGLLAAWQFAALLSGFLYEVSPTDPTVFAGALIAVCAVAAVAIVLPALRFSGADPAETLRYD